MFKLRKNMERPLTADEVDVNFLDVLIATSRSDYTTLNSDGYLFVNGIDFDYNLVSFDENNLIDSHSLLYVLSVDGSISVGSIMFSSAYEDANTLEILGDGSLLENYLFTVNNGTANNFNLTVSGLSYDFIYFKHFIPQLGR